MANDNKELVSSMLRKMTKLNYIKPGDVPGINLYMDQVTTFMDEHLSDSKRHEDDKILTKTMINNYTKNNLLPPPVKKKYSRDHLYILAFIYYLKNLLSISDIQKLINPLTENCFDTDKTPDMEDIYREVFNLCKSQAAALSRDTLEKARIAGKSFEYVEDEEQRDFLELFSLENKDECFDFFEDVCTINELLSLAQRFEVAKMLREHKTYLDIAEKTGASTATISRVNRSLNYGNDGYDRVFKRLNMLEETEE